MTERNSFKRLVRARMEKTGESYTAAHDALRVEEAPASGPSEFERQVGNLVARGYPKLAGLGEAEFRERLAPLAGPAAALGQPDGDGSDGRVPYALVVGRDLVDPERAAGLVERRGKRATLTMLEAGELERWTPVDGVATPAEDAYLVADVDTGRATLDVTPNDALAELPAGRSPLTIDEGIAVLTHHPEALQMNACFYTLGSRRGDKRVLALWLSKGAPKLGWCWAGNPHTWLGTASCSARVGGS